MSLLTSCPLYLKLHRFLLTKWYYAQVLLTEMAEREVGTEEENGMIGRAVGTENGMITIGVGVAAENEIEEGIETEIMIMTEIEIMGGTGIGTGVGTAIEKIT